jgi:hypothetical protein
MMSVCYEGISDEDLFAILADATARRAERRHEDLPIAAEEILHAAKEEFGIAEGRLPSRGELTLMASSLAQT